MAPSAYLAFFQQNSSYLNCSGGIFAEFEAIFNRELAVIIPLFSSEAAL